MTICYNSYLCAVIYIGHRGCSLSLCPHFFCFALLLALYTVCQCVGEVSMCWCKGTKFLDQLTSLATALIESQLVVAVTETLVTCQDHLKLKSSVITVNFSQRSGFGTIKTVL